MSTTGDPAVGAPQPEVIEALFLSPTPTDLPSFVESTVRASKLIGSPGFPFVEDDVRAQAKVAFDRGFHPAGTARQTAAIVNAPPRTSALRELETRTLVIHGDADPLIDPSAAQATATAIPGADLWIIPGMGHDLPPSLFATLADRISQFCLAG
jgi:pimeloyl-ACP methyl ester carboxylesterase